MARERVMSGARAAPAEMPQLPTSKIPPNDLEFRRVYANGKPIAGLPYTATLTDGTVKTGTTDASGVGRIAGVPAGAAKITYGEDYNPPETSVQAATHEDFDELKSIAAKSIPKA